MTNSSFIINLDTVQPQPLPPEAAPSGDAAQRYAPRVARLGKRLGATKLGCGVIALSAGMRAYPFHNHRANEEMFLILAGEGEIRIGAQTHPVCAGDLIACPAGGQDTAHQIVNTGTEELRYLAISTQLSPDVVEYPDTQRYAVLVADEPAPVRPAQGFLKIGRLGDAFGYWDGA
jgi:uncharacterized cupin superfamily protein